MYGRGREGVWGNCRRLRGVLDSEAEGAGLPDMFACKYETVKCHILSFYCREIFRHTLKKTLIKLASST